MTKPYVIALGCALAVAGIGGQASAQAGAQTPATAQHPVFVKQDLDQLSSPFTTPTVLKLNAIVARSKAAIDGFDAMIPAIRKDVSKAQHNRSESATGDAAMTRLTALATQAKAALTDMTAAEAHLKASGEPYNSAILQGMVDFVTQVESEIGTERRQLSSKLAKH